MVPEFEDLLCVNSAFLCGECARNLFTAEGAEERRVYAEEEIPNKTGLLCFFVATQWISSASSVVSMPAGRKLSSCPSRKISTSVAPSS